MRGFFPPIIMAGLNLKICQNFVGIKLLLTFVGDRTLWGEGGGGGGGGEEELKSYDYMGRVIFITTLSLFHFFRNR